MKMQKRLDDLERQARGKLNKGFLCVWQDPDNPKLYYKYSDRRGSEIEAAYSEEDLDRLSEEYQLVRVKYVKDWATLKPEGE